MVLYFVVLEGLFGATAGKLILGLRVIKIEGGCPGLFKGFMRNLMRIIDGLPAFSILGIILILTSEERTRLGAAACRLYSGLLYSAA